MLLHQQIITSSLHSADKTQQGTKQLSSVAILLYCFLSCLVRSKHRISLAVLVSLHFCFLFWLIRTLADPTLAVLIACDPLPCQSGFSLRSDYVSPCIFCNVSKALGTTLNVPHLLYPCLFVFEAQPCYYRGPAGGGHRS